MAYIKLSFTLILTINLTIALAQDWKSIRPSAVSYYSNDSTDIHAIRIDSSLISGDTTVYYPYKMFRPGSKGLYNVLGDNWIGAKIKTLPNGINIFNNKNHHPIIIETKASLNDSWPCYMYTDSSYIEAKVNSIGETTYLGKSDSVKTIMLSLKDKSGNLLFNQSDSCKYIYSSFLVLSKNHGFIKIIDFYKFPIKNKNEINDIYGSSYQYDLIGQTNPCIGYKKLTSKDFYDFDIGDEIDWSLTEYQSIYDYQGTRTTINSWSKTEYIDKIIAKYIASNDSSVTYAVHQKSKSYFSNNTNIQFNEDTIGRTYSFYPSNWWDNPDIYEPMEPAGTAFYLYSNTKVTKCYEPRSNDSKYLNEIWYKNAGYYYTYGYAAGHLLMDYYRQVYVLQYYTHDDYSWGSPFNFQSSLGVDTYPEGNSILYLYPNPAKNIIYFENTNNLNVTAMIYDNNGKQIKSQQTNNNCIDISMLSNGLYIFKLMNSGFIKTNKFIKN